MKIKRKQNIVFEQKKKGKFFKSIQADNLFTKRTRKIIGHVLLFLFCAIVLAFSIRGLPGNPTEKQLSVSSWRDDGPLELSPERGRFALLYAVAQDKTVQLSVELARFAAPDVGYLNGKYVSLFAPGVSFIALPGYLVGKYFGDAQVGSFAVIALFAILNVFLIRAIAVRLGAHPLAATIGALAFLFASPAYAYAVTLYQHHISTFLILLSIYLLLQYRSFLALGIVWMLCAFSISVDYPNFFLMLPIGVLAISRTFPVEKTEDVVKINFPILKILAVVAVILPLIFFFWFNKLSYGNPLQLSGTVERSVAVKPNGQPLLESAVVRARQKTATPQSQQEKSAIGFFQNRNLMNGFYIHFLSPDRGVIMFTPVMLFGLVGMWIAFRKKNKYLGLFIAIVGLDILLYSLWDDPYGGWAFGSRYLIPSYAICGIFISLALTCLKKYNLFLLIFFIMLVYSIGVNTLGAITSSSNPPQVEAIALEKLSHSPEEYTYLRNVRFLDSDHSKAFVFQAFAKQYVSAWSYYIYLTFFIVVASAFLVVTYRVTSQEDILAAAATKTSMQSRRIAVAKGKGAYAV